MTKYLSKKQRRKGFTLIELLVVMAIIGVLATFIVASFTSAQARARDAKRKSDFDSIKNALVLLKADSSNALYYPNCDSGVTCAPNTTGTALAPDLGSTYIRNVPLDPKNTGTSIYTYAPYNCDGPAAAPAGFTCRGFNLYTILENANDADTATSQTRCGVASASVVAGRYQTCSD